MRSYNVLVAFLFMTNSERKHFTINFPPNIPLSFHKIAIAKLLPPFHATKKTKFNNY